MTTPQKLEALSFGVAPKNDVELTPVDRSVGVGATRIINFASGIRMIHRDITCREDTLVDYDHNLPDRTSVGAFAALGHSASELYDINTTLVHATGNSYWGNVPNEDCASVLPAHKRVSIVYLSVSQSIFDTCGGRHGDSSDGTTLWNIVSGRATGVCDSGMVSRPLGRAMARAVRHPLNTPWDWLRVESLALDVLSRCLEDYAGGPDAVRGALPCKQDVDRVHEARRILLANLMDPPSIPQLARRAGLNEFKLKRLLKDVFGRPVYEYLTNYRLRFAAELIAHGVCSVSEAALEVGYANPAAFSVAFRRVMGTSPSDYRKRYFQPAVTASGDRSSRACWMAPHSVDADRSS